MPIKTNKTKRVAKPEQSINDYIYKTLNNALNITDICDMGAGYRANQMYIEFIVKLEKEWQLIDIESYIKHINLIPKSIIPTNCEYTLVLNNAYIMNNNKHIHIEYKVNINK